jgi:iron complex transport system ATP-binding protein
MLKVNNLKFSYGKGSKNVLDNISIEFNKGFNVILGPNGAGKSTLVKAIFGLLNYKGTIYYGCKNVSEMKTYEKVEFMSYLPQMDLDISSLTVLEMVLLGRLPELGHRVSDKDLNIVMETLEDLNINELTMRKFNELSGGQKKLVFIAQTLARNPEIILLDEPTNSLDLQKQLELCQLLRRIIKVRNVDIIVVLHDINLAARYADHIVVITSEGEHYNSGAAKDVITEKMLRDVYGVIGSVDVDDENKPVISAKKSVRDS